MSRHMRRALTRGPLASFVAIATMIAPLGAQVPEGWYATSNFQYCPGQPFSSAPGRVLIVNPDTQEQFEVEGLPDDLGSIPCDKVMQGGSSILIRPEDGALIVGEATSVGETLEIYILELDGFTVDSTHRFEVGIGRWSENEVSQLASLGDGRILFSCYGLRGRQGLGVLDPSDPDEPVRLFGRPVEDSNALAVDLEEEVAYLAFPDDDQRPFSGSTIFAVSIPELLDSGEAGERSVASVPFFVTSLSASQDGELLAVGFGQQAGLFAIDPEGGAIDLLCTDIRDSRSDANAVTVDPQREEIVVHFGGPVINRGLRQTVVAFRLEDGGCSVEQRGASSIGVHGILSGIAVNSGAPEPRVAFLRGDCNGDGAVNVSDASCALNWLFAGGPEAGCVAALNTNSDAKVDIADAVSLLGFLFGGGPMITAPFPECGPGTLPADESLGCENPPNCQ